ncbi:unnamed protein product [Didymodactylos carnosus]|uniref:Uncharacterized protein n=1 Tax=Didymodactylos carnosus TaxID=1234261 RepID=A0A814RQ70_9BILA|nr:unnamed protein product [Didymodactylos carnosus]CAF1223718.1 unnamed protein product [Didymodactylos carnosus]CAF3899567.1 unnamed protein product [Didymodactylos carnosus]CAF4031973.1 unnamed protein product [Didymodactylos carnosus]
MFSKPLLVDLWWIDPQGNVQMVIKTTELYVYLCKQERHPKTLNNTTIIPHLPAHLPPQHIVLIKYVKNLVTNDDVKDELNSRFESVFAIDSMSGATNERSRHVKIEFLQKNEIDSLLNSAWTNIGSMTSTRYLHTASTLTNGQVLVTGGYTSSAATSGAELCDPTSGNWTTTGSLHTARYENTAATFWFLD